MTKVIAIFLILKAVSNGIKLPQRDNKTKNDFIGHILVESIMLIVHLYFGVWMLLNLC
jgi:hypothetical protein